MSGLSIPWLRERPRFLAALRWLALPTAVWTLALWCNPGLDVSIAGVRISTRTLWRPLLVLVIALVGHVAAIGVRATAVAFIDMFRLPAPLRFLSKPAIWVAVIAAATVAQGVYFNAHGIGGSDSYGYAAEAELLLEGTLTAQLPPATVVPWPNPTATLTPLAFTPALNNQPAMVPIVPPGLPLLFAAAKIVAGTRAIFWIPPLCGALLVICTYLIGTRFSRRVGLAAALLVATSPAMLYMLVQPMSDVPAAACWALVVACLLGDSTGAMIAAGLSASFALLVRPNLLPIDLVLGVWLLSPFDSTLTFARRIRQAAIFSACALPGILALALFNSHLYGSPLSSGYGDLGTLFSLHNVSVNAAHYISWLSETQTPIACLGLLSLFIPALWFWKTREARHTATLLAFLAVVVAAIYCFYKLFDAWWFLRFLLPIWPALFIGTALMLARATDLLGRVGRPLFAVTVLALGINAIVTGVDPAHAVYTIGESERRYIVMAKLAADRTEPTCMIFSQQHAGSLRYYAGRWTLRYDLLDAQWLDRAVDWLAARGVHSYLVVEPWEVEVFTSRFAGSDAVKRLKTAPRVVYVKSANVSLYDLSPAAAYSMETVQSVPLTREDFEPKTLPALPLRK